MSKKYKAMFSIVFIICFFMFLNHKFYVSPENILTRADIDENKLSEEEIKQFNQTYKLKFELSDSNFGKVKTYVPEYKYLDENAVLYYFNMFGLDKFDMETDEYYYGENDQCYLYVYKYDGRLKYISKVRNKNDIEINEQQAMDIGTDFIENNLAFLDYDEIEIIENENYFMLKYIDSIDNIEKHGFNTRIIIDKYGNILEMEYYFINFEKLDEYKIKTMEEAFYDLPLNYDTTTEIYLDSSYVVYIYENSILQPAYMFEGETSTGDYFRTYIKATKFN